MDALNLFWLPLVMGNLYDVSLSNLKNNEFRYISDF